jgi:hypothetical protein
VRERADRATELIADRIWRTRSPLELAIVEYVGWFKQRRLHGALGIAHPPSSKPSTLPGPRHLSLYNHN